MVPGDWWQNQEDLSTPPAEAMKGLPLPMGVDLPVDLPKLLRDLEGAYISAALVETNDNKLEAAKLLGLRRTTLMEKLRRHPLP